MNLKAGYRIFDLDYDIEKIIELNKDKYDYIYYLNYLDKSTIAVEKTKL